MNIKETLLSKFMERWHLAHCKGRNDFILKNGIIKPIIIFTLTFLMYICVRYDNVFNTVIYDDSIYAQYALITLGIAFLGYICSYNFWIINNRLYLKFNLKKIMERRMEFQSLKHGDE